jgi:two-component system, NarL family, nitrate/nitrite response regulator NarL
MDDTLDTRKELIRIGVVDDHPLYREGVVSTIEGQADMEVVAQGATHEEAMRLAENSLPDVLLLDVRMPGGGLTCAAALAKRFPFTKVVMLTVSEDEEDVLEAFRVGVRAYVLKGIAGGDLVGIVRSVHAGEVYVTPTLASRVLAEMSGTDAPSVAPTAIESLTARERQILERVTLGDINKEIAYELGITEKTVKHYMTNIMQKLHARNRVEAAILAHQAGLGQSADTPGGFGRG